MDGGAGVGAGDGCYAVMLETLEGGRHDDDDDDG